MAQATHTEEALGRRAFLRRGAISAGAVVVSLSAGRTVAAAPTRLGPGPYGELLPPDANGLMLPAGFSSRVVAQSLTPVGASGYEWHAAPDGGACFATVDGGWIYTSNAELPFGLGGGGALRFSAAGQIVDAYSILAGTTANCAGGRTPWGTWLSCEEHDEGLVWECDPLGQRPAVAHPKMGAFVHEAAAVDPVGRQLYMTEDVGDGRLYRYTPTRYPDLSDGRLEVAVAEGDRGRVTWAPVADPAGSEVPTRLQVPESKAFDGGEGLWCDTGFLYFTTKGDNRVWSYDIKKANLDVLYDAADFEDAPLAGVDNVVVAPSGDVIVAEDGADMDLVLITPERSLSRLVKVTGQDESEITGPAFDPSGRRLYFSSQRGPASGGFGVTYEVTGPFRTRRPAGGIAPPAPLASQPTTTTTRGASPRANATDDGLGPIEVTSVAALAGLGLVASALGLRRLRSRRVRDPEPELPSEHERDDAT